MPIKDLGAERRSRIDAARLYLVCDCLPGNRSLKDFLPATISGGVEVLQLRDKQLDGDHLAAAARVAADVCREHGALFILNDYPHLAAEVHADGVHVGQDDMSVAEAREVVGPDMLIGLSTHSQPQIDADEARLADYIGVGPVHETPTKPGRPAVGVELISTQPSQIPWYTSEDMASVDDLDTLAGRAALAFALAGDHGAYGVKPTATSSLLPHVVGNVAQP